MGLKRLMQISFPLSVTITHEIMCSLMLIGGYDLPGQEDVQRDAV